MDVLLGIIRGVELDDPVNGGNVEATGSDVGGEKNAKHSEKGGEDGREGKEEGENGKGAGRRGRRYPCSAFLNSKKHFMRFFCFCLPWRARTRTSM